jgi:hypothetical protein
VRGKSRGEPRSRRVSAEPASGPISPVVDLVPDGEKDLTVAVTGPTGTFGFGLMPLFRPTIGWRGWWASLGARSTPAPTAGRRWSTAAPMSAIPGHCRTHSAAPMWWCT